MDRVEEIEQCAADWLARRSSGSWSAAEQAQLQDWLQASTQHKVAFIRLEAAWHQANRLRALSAGVLPGTVPPRGHWQRAAPTEGSPPDTNAVSASRTKWSDDPPEPAIDGGVREGVARYRRASSWVAAAVLVVALGTVAYLWPRGDLYRTTVGAVAAIPMSDGSKVTLNTNSQIRIAITERERRVHLGRGEAFFEVAKDPSRPFVVVAGDCKVVAVGTKFSVWREAGEVRVAVTEGRVRVERSDGDASPQTADEVTAGSIAHAGDAGVLVQRKHLREVEEDLSWLRGFLFFHDVPLAEAVAEFNRYNRVRIVIASPNIAAIRIGGNFRSTNVAGFVRLLQDGFSIHVEQRRDEIILTGS